MYHYVDDLAYRQLNDLGLSDPIAQEKCWPSWLWQRCDEIVLGAVIWLLHIPGIAAFEDRQVSARLQHKGSCCVHARVCWRCQMTLLPAVISSETDPSNQSVADHCSQVG